MSAASPPEAEPASEYRVEPAVAREIARLSGLARPRLLAEFAAGDSVEARVQEETLVHFLRRFHKQGDSDAAGEIVRLITRRLSRRLARLTAVWRLGAPPDLADDVIDEVLTDLYEQLFTTDGSAAFWEIRFWVCFNRRALTILRRRRAELDQMADEEEPNIEESAAPESALGRSMQIDQPEMRALISDALAGLPQPIRTAFLLKHWAGYPEDSGIAGTVTIASMMGVTGRTVRNYITRAEQCLAQWRAGEGGDQDE